MKPDTTQPREQASEQALMEAACARRYSDGDYKHTSILMRLSTERDAYRAGWKDRAALASPITAPEAPIYLALQRMENPYNEKDHGPGWQVAAHAWDMAIISAMRIAHAPLVPEVAASEQQACWSCKKPYTLEQRAEADGNCPHCGVEIELATPAATTASASREVLYVECRECKHCQHVGINDASGKLAACHSCDWNGPSPSEDKCPGCGNENCMGAACPKCGALYGLLAEGEFRATAPSRKEQA